MVLFNIGSHLSFGNSRSLGSRLSFNNSHKHHRGRRRRKSYHSSKSHRKTGVYIDIGEEEPLHIEIENTKSYNILNESNNSVCILVEYEDDIEDETLLIKWREDSNIRAINSRDHIATKFAEGIVEVPHYKHKEIIKYYNKNVSISRRSYIKGQTLKSVMTSLEDDDIDAIYMQIQVIIWELAKKTSDYFGHIQDGALKTATPAAYLRTRSFLDKLKSRIDAYEWTEQGNDSYLCKAVMCHGNLSPEHIILNGNKVVGIVGWSEADFVPEIYDRLKYYFRSNPSDPQCWFRKLSDISSSIESRRPSVEFVVNATTYLYKSMWSNVPLSRRNVLTRLFKAITTNYTLVNCISIATEIESDNMSLDSLSTWCKSAASTATANN